MNECIHNSAQRLSPREHVIAYLNWLKILAVAVMPGIQLQQQLVRTILTFPKCCHRPGLFPLPDESPRSRRGNLGTCAASPLPCLSVCLPLLVTTAS